MGRGKYVYVCVGEGRVKRGKERREGGKGGLKYMEHRTKDGNRMCGRTVITGRKRKRDARISCAIRREERKLWDGTLFGVVHLSQPVSGGRGGIGE